VRHTLAHPLHTYAISGAFVRAFFHRAVRTREAFSTRAASIDTLPCRGRTAPWAGPNTAIMSCVSFCTVTNSLEAISVTRATVRASSGRAIGSSEPCITHTGPIQTFSVSGTVVRTYPSTAVVAGVAMMAVASSIETVAVVVTIVRARPKVALFARPSWITGTLPIIAMGVLITATGAATQGALGAHPPSVTYTDEVHTGAVKETTFRTLTTIALCTMKTEFAVTRAVATHTVISAIVGTGHGGTVFTFSIIGTRAHQINTRKSVARIRADGDAAVVRGPPHVTFAHSPHTPSLVTAVFGTGG